MERSTTLRKNPSREACEKVIKRILMTEVLEHGSNKHFQAKFYDEYLPEVLSAYDMKISFDENGNILPVKMTFEGVKKDKL